MTEPKIDVKTDGRELTMTRIFDAPPELVFEAYSSCTHLKHWWGPREWPMQECKMEFKEGGVWHYCLRGPNEGDESWGKAVYIEILKPQKIVYEDNFWDEEGNINKQMPGMLVTVKFFEHSGKTRLVSSTLFDTPESLKSIVEMGVIEGMNSTMDRLEEHLLSLQ